MKHEVPAPGFRLVSGKRGPTGGKWFVQFRCGYVDDKHAYEPAQLRWKHDGGEWDVVAVRAANDGPSGVVWNPKSGGY